MKENKLFKKLSLGIASLVLVTPLALSSVSSTAVSANSNRPRTASVTPDESRSSFLKHSKGSQQQSNLLRHAKTIFVQRGNNIYKAKANGANMFPSTMKYYSKVSIFKKTASKMIKKLNYNKHKYRKTHKRYYLKRIKSESSYTELAQLPSSYRVPNKKRNTSFVITNYKGVKETLLKSEFKRGSYKQAKKAGFAYGPRENNAFTIFSKYKPNSKRAIVPKNFHIRPDQTVWLVGHHTNSFYKINRFHLAYYYNGQYKGWAYIGL